LALDRICQETFSIQSPLGIYTPTLLLQGSADAGNYIQGATAPLLLSNSYLVNRLLQRLDEVLLHAATENGLLKALRTFFQVCREYRLKVHAFETNIFMKEATGFLWSNL
jgi:hypothetical protein